MHDFLFGCPIFSHKSDMRIAKLFLPLSLTDCPPVPLAAPLDAPLAAPLPAPLSMSFWTNTNELTELLQLLK